MHKLQPNSRHCFVCGLANSYGLQLRFFQTGPGEVTTQYTVPEQFQGYPGIVHGGIVSAMLDEVTGRAHLVDDPSRFMYTARFEVRFRKIVPVGKPLRIVGKVEQVRSRIGTSVGTIYGPDGDVLAEAKALLVDQPQSIVESDDFDTLGWGIYNEEGELIAEG